MATTLPDEYLVRMTQTRHGRIRSRLLGDPVPGSPPVVAVMGMAVSTYLLPGLAVLGRWTRTYLVDLPGLAGSGPADERLDVPGYAAALIDWLDAADLPPVVLIGHSSSTQVVTQVAVARPERVRALVLGSPTVDPTVRSWPRLLYAWLRDARGLPMPGLGDVHRPEWRRAGVRQIANLVSAHLHDRLEDTLPRVRCPVLVLRGRCDGISTERWARGLADGAPHGRFAAVPGPHTFVWYDPEAWDAPIRELVAAGDSAPAAEGDQR